MNDELSNNDYPAVQFRIARPTNKIEEVTEFYTKGLGLKVLYEFEGHEGYRGVMIGLPDLQYHLEFTQDGKGTPGKAPTKDNLLVLYFKTLAELNIIKDKLTALGCHPIDPENPYWKDKGFTFEDPDGWRVVLNDGVFNV
ncbi:VOC family protein [Segetibacter aerophilus]|uniref:VOC domain-containing protein n=1 Tax=Segetibacter aerophilus TaxID=670293 RepID=A0A512BI47_9BACT|nr:VOC family protein [Segetibacter aerophilus]GEO11646.1 hypothetical protein SAE01_41420 [Segetibacter aerophilus]